MNSEAIASLRVPLILAGRLGGPPGYLRLIQRIFVLYERCIGDAILRQKLDVVREEGFLFGGGQLDSFGGGEGFLEGVIGRLRERRGI